MATTYSIGALSKALKSKENNQKGEKLQNLFRIDENKLENAPLVYVPQETQPEKTDGQQKSRLKRRKAEEDLKEEEEERKPKKKPKIIEKDPKEDERTVFVGNLPNTIDKKGITRLFQKYGNVESVRIRSVALADPKLPRKLAVIKRDFNKNRSNVNAYVKFSTPDEAKLSLKLNGKVVNGYHVRVDLESNCKEHDNTKSVFLGNLSFKLEEDAVYSHFEDCGEIEGVRLIRDSQTGIGKGFGYVLFQTKHSVELALRLNGTDLNGRSVRVTRAVKDAKKKFKHVDTNMKKKEANEEKQGKKNFLDKYLKKTPKQKNKKKQKTNKK